MVLGLGVHGESGVKKMKLSSAKDTVMAMLDHMMDKDSFTSLNFNDTKDVAVLINNLGSVTNLEMGVLTKAFMLLMLSNLDTMAQEFELWC